MSLFSIVTDILSYWWVIPVVWIGFRTIRILILVPFFPSLDWEKIKKEGEEKEEEERKRKEREVDRLRRQREKEEFHNKVFPHHREEVRRKKREEEERKIYLKNKERLLVEEKEQEELRKKEEKERLLREKELEPLRKKKGFWFELSGLETEKELHKVFKKLGFKTELTPLNNDEGIDHVLNGNIVVQTKNTKKKVSRPDLQRFWGSWKDSHKKGIFVSIHGFTRTCKDFIKDKPILLYDVNDVIGMSEGKKPEWNE